MSIGALASRDLHVTTLGILKPLLLVDRGARDGGWVVGRQGASYRRRTVRRSCGLSELTESGADPVLTNRPASPHQRNAPVLATRTHQGAAPPRMGIVLTFQAALYEVYAAIGSRLTDTSQPVHEPDVMQSFFPTVEPP